MPTDDEKAKRAEELRKAQEARQRALIQSSDVYRSELRQLEAFQKRRNELQHTSYALIKDFDRWENHINFRPAEGDYDALLAEFKQFIQYSNTVSRAPLHLLFKAWLWSKGIQTITRRKGH